MRATINQTSKYELVVTEIPFGTTTASLMESILAANAREKIKIRKIEDNTSDKVELVIHLPQGADPEKTIGALYAFTDCEIAISPNACVIKDGKPAFMSVDDILKYCTENTLALLKKDRSLQVEVQGHTDDVGTDAYNQMLSDSQAAAISGTGWQDNI